jgi:hypothetical protein
LPVAAYAGKLAGKVSLKLVRSSNERPVAALLTDIEQWCRYAVVAARVRLEPLSFAMNEEGLVIVRGQPAPSIPGTRFADHDGILVPVGWAWSPAVSAAVLRRVLGLSGDEVAIWLADGRVERLHKEQFVPATRSAVRLTAAALEEVPDVAR